MKKIVSAALSLLALSLTSTGAAQSEQAPELTEFWEPVPKIVSGVKDGAPPSDALVLFDGSNTAAWQHRDGTAVKWDLIDGAMQVKGGTGSIITKQSFADVQLHIEWRTPAEVVGDSQGRGNSGIFLQDLYEVQVLDNYDNPTYVNGQAGSIYKQTPPLVNASHGPGEWQTYDIIFKAPVFNRVGGRVSPGTITVIHNGVVVQNHTEIQGSTEYRGAPLNVAHGKAPIQLQDHGNPVAYRNIWLREL